MQTDIILPSKLPSHDWARKDVVEQNQKPRMEKLYE